MEFLNWIKIALAIGLLAWLSSCGEIVFVDTDAPPQSKEDSIRQAEIDTGLILSYIDSKGFDQVYATSNAIRYTLISSGNGLIPEYNDIVSVNYIARFLNDSIIDTNIEQLAKAVPISKDNFTYGPLVFNYTSSISSIYYPGVYGYLSLMPGLAQGIVSSLSLMDEGSKAIIILPSIQAMGIRGYKLTTGFNIPVNEVLVFEISLVRVRKYN